MISNVSAPFDARSAERRRGLVRGATKMREPTSNDAHARATIPRVTGIFVPINTTRTSPSTGGRREGPAADSQKSVPYYIY